MIVEKLQALPERGSDRILGKLISQREAVDAIAADDLAAVDRRDIEVRDLIAEDIHKTLTDERRGCDHDLGVNTWTGMPDPPLCVLAAQNAMDALADAGVRLVR